MYEYLFEGIMSSASDTEMTVKWLDEVQTLFLNLFNHSVRVLWLRVYESKNSA